jgi:hypothetical protein
MEQRCWRPDVADMRRLPISWTKPARQAQVNQSSRITETTPALQPAPVPVQSSVIDHE